MIFWQVHEYWFQAFVCNMLSRRGGITQYLYMIIMIWHMCIMIIWFVIKHSFYPRSLEVEQWVFRWTFSPPSPPLFPSHLQLLDAKTTSVDNVGWWGGLLYCRPWVLHWVCALVLITPINPSWMFGVILHQHLFCQVSCSSFSMIIVLVVFGVNVCRLSLKLWIIVCMYFYFFFHMII